MSEVFCGIDLSASPRRPSGLALIEGGAAESLLVYDDELKELLAERSPSIIAIDAPLSLPSHGAMREVDRALVRMGFRVLPPAWRGMLALTNKAVSLAAYLAAVVPGALIVETHPTSALKSSGCASVQDLLAALGVSLRRPPAGLTKDEADALVAAAVAKAVALGLDLRVSASDGTVHLLKPICPKGGAAPRHE